MSVKKEPDSPDLFAYIDQGSPNLTSSSINQSDSKKKRVGKACDSCRIKKCRCDGRKPCTKCVADNKICVYSERKRPRDKVYPSDYVELLETRLDLLSKSLEKLIDLALSGEDINFLKTPGEKFSVNKIINQLVSDHGLLDNQPVEWDTATKLLAELPDDNEGIAQISNVYLEHTKQLNSAAETAAAIKLKDKQERKKNKIKLRKNQLDSTIDDQHSNNDLIQPIPSHSSADSDIHIRVKPEQQFDHDLQTDISLQGFQPRDDDFTQLLNLGSFTSGALILALLMEGGLSMSDFESDNNRAQNNYSPIGTNSPFSDSGWNNSAIFNNNQNDDSNIITNSPLFLDTGKLASSHDLLQGKSSYTSMNSSLFNENPPSIHQMPQSPKLESSLRRTNSKPYSLSSTPSGKKLVNTHSGQIIKPHHTHHHRSSSFNSSNPLRNNSSTISSPETKGLQSPNSFISNSLVDELNMFDMISLSPGNENLNGIWIDDNN